MPKIVDASERRLTIRKAARKVFSKRGVGGTGLEHVALEAQVGRSSLYHYYPDKRSLVEALMEETIAEESGIVGAVLVDSDSPRALIEALVEVCARRFDAWAAVVFLRPHSTESAFVRRVLRKFRGSLAELVTEGQEVGDIDPWLDPDIAASLIIGAIDGLLFQYAVDREHFPDREALAWELRRAVVRILLP